MHYLCKQIIKNCKQVRLDKKAITSEARDYLFITIGMISYCIGWKIFLLPNNVTSSGVPGVASIIYWATNIPAQWTYFAINAVLLVLALFIIGYKFCIKTIYAVVIVTLFTSFLDAYTHQVSLLHDQPFMASVLGAVFCGCGIGMGFANNGSTGGTDIIAAIVNKYHDVSLGKVIMLCDVLIVSSSYLVLHDWEKVIYGYVVLYISAFCIDQVVNAKRRSVQFFIISKKYKEIGQRINRNPHRGCTVIDASGFYSGQEVKMLFVLARQRESNTIFQLIQEVDPSAFVSQSAVIGVYGEGFDRIKHKRKEPKKISSEALAKMADGE